MVVLLMLIPLLAPSESGAPAGLKTIAQALGIAAVKVAPHHTSLPDFWQFSLTEPFLYCTLELLQMCLQERYACLGTKAALTISASLSAKLACVEVHMG